MLWRLNKRDKTQLGFMQNRNSRVIYGVSLLFIASSRIHTSYATWTEATPKGGSHAYEVVRGMLNVSVFLAVNFLAIQRLFREIRLAAKLSRQSQEDDRANGLLAEMCRKTSPAYQQRVDQFVYAMFGFGIWAMADGLWRRSAWNLEMPRNVMGVLALVNALTSELFEEAIGMALAIWFFIAARDMMRLRESELIELQEHDKGSAYGSEAGIRSQRFDGS